MFYLIPDLPFQTCFFIILFILIWKEKKIHSTQEIRISQWRPTLFLGSLEFWTYWNIIIKFKKTLEKTNS